MRSVQEFRKASISRLGLTKGRKTKAKRSPKYQPLLGMPIFGKYESI
jgi:hypothetical protein